MSHYPPPCIRPHCPKALTRSKIVMNLVFCSFKRLEDDMVQIATKYTSFKFGISPALKEALATMQEDLVEKYKISAIPEKGFAVVQGNTLSDSVVTAFFPVFDSENFDEYLSPIEQAIALYSGYYDAHVEIFGQKDLQERSETSTAR